MRQSVQMDVIFKGTILKVIWEELLTNLSTWSVYCPAPGKSTELNLTDTSNQTEWWSKMGFHHHHHHHIQIGEWLTL